jgi:probable HAF family extracellular repeat protein
MRHGFNALALLFLLLVWSSSSVHATTYQVHYLDTPPGSTSEARALNDSGMIVGEIWSVAILALWDTSGALATPILQNAWGYDINNNGQVVGLFQSSSGYSLPFAWSRDVGMTDLSTALPPSAEVRCINTKGQMAGSIGLAGPYQTFAWDAASGITYLPLTGYESSYPMGISDSGVVAGTVTLPDHTCRAFTWAAEGGLTMPFPDDSSNSALAISAGGMLLGNVEVGERIVESFIWSAERGKVTIGISTEDHPFWPSAVNDRGQVAGTMFSPEEGQRAFVWDPETGITILGEGVANDINNSGWVAGMLGNSQTGRAVVWEPVPEPSSLMALGMGVLPLAFVVARRRDRKRT